MATRTFIEYIASSKYTVHKAAKNCKAKIMHQNFYTRKKRYDLDCDLQVILNVSLPAMTLKKVCG